MRRAYDERGAHPPARDADADAARRDADAARRVTARHDVIAMHAATRRDVIERIEQLACIFVRDALAATNASDMPPKVVGLRGVARRRETRFDRARGGWVVDTRVASRRRRRIDADGEDEGCMDDDVADVETRGGDVADDDAGREAATSVAARFHFSRDGGAAYHRFWSTLDVIRQGLRRECSMTMRELYYVMLSRGRGDHGERLTDGKLTDTIRQISAAIGAPRNALGLSAASKGQVCGRVHVETAFGSRHDCTMVGSGGFAITGDMCEMDAMTLYSDAAYVVVVEKDAVFQRLLNERIFDVIPCVVITAKGFPDFATRKFLFLLERALERNPIQSRFYMLADFNPSGLWIWSSYSSGSGASLMDSVPYAVPLELIGLCADDLRLVPENAFQPLTSRDESLIENALAAGERAPLFAHRRELETMRARGQKAEIEALYANDDSFSLSAFIAAKIAEDEARRREKRATRDAARRQFLNTA